MYNNKKMSSEWCEKKISSWSNNANIYHRVLSFSYRRTMKSKVVASEAASNTREGLQVNKPWGDMSMFSIQNGPLRYIISWQMMAKL